MPLAARLNDTDTGHGLCGSTPIIDAVSPNVIINGLPAATLNSILADHCLHSRAVSAGSPTVMVNGKPLARVGDPINCGGTIAQGSPNVIAN